MTLKYTKQSIKSNVPIFWVLGVILVSLQIPNITDSLSENRTYRDLVNITPFHDVHVFETKKTEKGLLVAGEMTKRRCDFKSLTAYVLLENGPKKRTTLDTSFEPFEGSRPPGKRSESWGPWKVMWDKDVEPIGYQIFAHHVKCPTKPEIQDNLFIEGAWENFHEPHITDLKYE